jgi:hypothetical protein
MAAGKKEQTNTASAPTANSGYCIADGCKKSTELAEFCGSHFVWFKLGLITKKGAKAKDFEKKLSQLNRSADKTL